MSAESFLVPALPFAISGQQPQSEASRAALRRTAMNWQSLIRWPALVGDRGSQNLPLLAAAAGLGLTFEHDQVLHDRLLDAWGEYLKKPLWSKEPLSRIYGSWILTSMLVARAFAKHAARTDPQRERLWRDLQRAIRSSATILTLGTGCSRVQGRFPGHPVTLCGSRSASSAPPRLDPQGRPLELLFLKEDHPLNAILAALLRIRQPGWWEGDVSRAVAGRLGINPMAALTPQESAALTRLMRARSPDEVDAGALRRAVSWIQDAPRPLGGVHLIRTTEGSATCVENSINPGSTPPLYAHAWWEKSAPPRSALKAYPWGRSLPYRRVDALWIDNPGLRGQGKAGKAKVDMDRRLVTAERSATNDHFDDRTGLFKPGPKTMALPGGKVLWHVWVAKKTRRLA